MGERAVHVQWVEWLEKVAVANPEGYNYHDRARHLDQAYLRAPVIVNPELSNTLQNDMDILSERRKVQGAKLRNLVCSQCKKGASKMAVGLQEHHYAQNVTEKCRMQQKDDCVKGWC